jgi:hypothetical protein
MRYKQSREKPTPRRYAVAKRENKARHQFPRPPVVARLQRKPSPRRKRVHTLCRRPSLPWAFCPREWQPPCCVVCCTGEPRENFACFPVEQGALAASRHEIVDRALPSRMIRRCVPMIWHCIPRHWQVPPSASHSSPSCRSMCLPLPYVPLSAALNAKQARVVRNREMLLTERVWCGSQ